jgi:hypothetical protein
VADDAGALLVRSGLVSASALDEARARAVDQGGTLGEQLVAGGLVADEALTDFYKSRLLVPQVNPNTLARLPAKVVAVIPSDMAIELRAIPVSLDKDNNLTVAMGDPSDRHAVDEIAFFTSAYVVRACATQMQIAWCLAHYYGHVTPLGERLLQPTGGASSPRALAAAVRPGPRPRGHTGRIEAMRHRALVPGEAAKPAEPAPPEPIAPPEPAAAVAAEPAPEPPIEPAPAPPVDAVPEAAPVQRARSVSGEIRVPKLRAASIKPPMPADEEPTEASGPIIAIEAGEPSGRTAAPDGDEPTLTSGPIISIEVDESEGGPSEEPTDRSRPAPPRRTRPAEPDPPELAARAGEVQLKTGPHRMVALEEPRVVIADELDEPDEAAVIATSRTTTARMAQRPPGDEEAEPDLPAVAGELVVRTSPRATDRAITPTITVEITDEPSAPVVIHEQIGERSEPVLLEQRRTLVDTPAQPDPDDDAVVEEVLELPPKRLGTARPRGDRRTQLGIGVIAAVTRDGAVGSELDDQPTGSRAAAPPDDDPTKLDTPIAPEGDYSSSDDLLAAPPSPVSDDDTSPVTIPPPLPIWSPVPPPSGKVSLDNVRARAASDDEDEDDDDGVPPGRATTVMPAIDPLDDGWGPPGTTIPPPLLGAMPGAIEPESGVIPISNVDSAPLMISPPLAPEVSRPDISQGTLARALQDATVYVLDLIRDLEHAEDRDEVVALMIQHLARTHRRTGFFAVRAGELSLFAVNPRPAAVSHATLRLDRPSTLQDIVGTRLPYRGPMQDDASRSFLAAVLGVSPPEILLVPVTVRERVVGILFGEHRTAHSFEDQLALAARAAGIALERILKARRG